MPRYPVLSGRDVLLALGREQVGRRGSHVKVRRGSTTVIVPDHREIRRGTLGSIVQQAGVSVEELVPSLTN